MEPEVLGDYLLLTFCFEKLQWPSNLPLDELQNMIVAIVPKLEIIGFKRERQALLALADTLKTAAISNPEKFLTPNSWADADDSRFFVELKEIVRDAYIKLIREFSRRRILLLDQGAVTSRLRELQEDITGDEKQIILADTLRCLETGAYRAAMVMGWNLAYEHLRRWIFKSKRTRLRDFNAELTTRWKNKTANYDPISAYEDFYDLKESMVLDVAHQAKLLPKQKWQVLSNALTDRNHFAHPSSRRATAATATGYIENLVVNILTDPHFDYK